MSEKRQQISQHRTVGVSDSPEKPLTRGPHPPCPGHLPFPRADSTTAFLLHKGFSSVILAPKQSGMLRFSLVTPAAISRSLVHSDLQDDLPRSYLLPPFLKKQPSDQVSASHCVVVHIEQKFLAAVQRRGSKDPRGHPGAVLFLAVCLVLGILFSTIQFELGSSLCSNFSQMRRKELESNFF